MSAEHHSHREINDRKGRGAALWAAFKTFAILFSFIINFVLVVVLIIVVGWILFPAKTDLVEPMLDDLQGAVVALDEATIMTTIPIDQQVPVNFTLPLNQSTIVTLTQPVALVQNATFYLPGNGGQINGTVALSLPEGMALPVQLSLNVPVNNTIPVRFPVDVSIPLKETELNLVVVKLDKVLNPIRTFLDDLPDSLPETLSAIW